MNQFVLVLSRPLLCLALLTLLQGVSPLMASGQDFWNNASGAGASYSGEQQPSSFRPPDVAFDEPEDAPSDSAAWSESRFAEIWKRHDDLDAPPDKNPRWSDRTNYQARCVDSRTGFAGPTRAKRVATTPTSRKLFAPETVSSAGVVSSGSSLGFPAGKTTNRGCGALPPCATSSCIGLDVGAGE